MTGSAVSGTQPPQSSDATLSALSLVNAADDAAIALTPTFVSGTESYTASVLYSVVSTTVTATPTHASATEVIKLGGTEDADATVNLALGDNVITVEVIAQDGTTKTYTVTVTRAQTALSGTALVSNTGQADSSATNVGNNAWAQSFTTGSNAGGYNLSSIEVSILGLPSTPPTSSQFTVTIWSATAGTVRPESVLHTLTSPGTFTANAVNTFTAPANTVLAASTTYFVRLNNTSGRNVTVKRTTSTAEDSGAAAGWSIGNTRYYRSRGLTGTSGWSDSNNVFKMAVKGSAVGGTTNNEATGEPTISGANLVGQTQTANKGSIADADGLPLESTFTYQWIRVSSGSEADISGATSKTYTTVSADQGKKLKVKVGFTDNASNDESRTSLASEIIGATSCTPSAPAAAIWSACLTVDQSGYYFTFPGAGDNFGALSNPEVTVGGNTYTINDFERFGSSLFLAFTSAPGNAASGWVLYIGSASTSFALSAATTSSADKVYNWTNTSLTWSGGDVISVWIAPAVSTNNAPVFPSGTITRSVAENTASGQNVGSPVAATDDDAGDTLTYSLEGADGGSFTIVSTSGQIQTKTLVTYNYEAKSSYSVTVKVNDGTVNVTKAVTISVTDVAEPPDQPAAPTVAARAGTDDSLNVIWTAPANTGRPAIDDYNVQYRIGTTGSFTSHSFSGTGRFTTIAGLTASTSYQVQVQAHNDEGDSPWSALRDRQHQCARQRRADVPQRDDNAERGREHGLRPERGRAGGGHGHRRGHPDLQPGGDGRRLLHHRLHQRPDPDQDAGDLQLRGQEQLLGDREGERRHGERHQGGDHQRHRRGRAAGPAGCAYGDGKVGHHRQPGRELERAGQHRASGHRRLQRAVPDRDHRVVHQP